jgi:hypothetical protein
MLLIDLGGYELKLGG